MSPTWDRAERLCFLSMYHSGASLVWVGWGVWVCVCPSGVSVPRGCVRASPPAQGLVYKGPPPRACGCRNPSFLLRQSLGGKGQRAEPLPGRASDRHGPRAPQPSCPRPRPRSPLRPWLRHSRGPSPPPTRGTPRPAHFAVTRRTSGRSGMDSPGAVRKERGSGTLRAGRRVGAARRGAGETPVAGSLLAPREQHGDGQGRGRAVGAGLGMGAGPGEWRPRGLPLALFATLSPTRGLLVLAKSRFFCGSAVPLSSWCVPVGEGTT